MGFYDHEGVERARSFPTAKAAREWMDDYITAERRGPDSLRRFLLDLDAREANAATEARTLGEVVQLYFAFNAPDTADGLATSTFRTYSWSANCHLLGHEAVVKGKKVRPAKYAVRRQFSAADGAGSVPAGQERLEFPDDLKEGQAAALSRGRRSARSRCRVRNACATLTSVTWWLTWASLSSPPGHPYSSPSTWLVHMPKRSSARAGPRRGHGD